MSKKNIDSVEEIKKEWGRFLGEIKNLSVNVPDVGSDYDELKNVVRKLEKIGHGVEMSIKMFFNPEGGKEELYRSKESVIDGKIGTCIFGVYNALDALLSRVESLGAEETKKAVKIKIADMALELKQAGLALGMEFGSISKKKSGEIGYPDVLSGCEAVKILEKLEDPENVVFGKDIKMAIQAVNNRLKNVVEIVVEIDKLLTDIKKPN